MDDIDERILSLLKSNARMTSQELGDELGMSRVAVKKRVIKLEEAGIIRGYNTTIYREDEVTSVAEIKEKMFIWYLMTIPKEKRLQYILDTIEKNRTYAV